MIAEAYGQGPRYSYFEGWSNGGRQGMMEAQRYPDDFDGIIAGSPVMDLTGANIGHNHNQRTVLAAPIPPAKLSILAQAVLAQCDSQDGLVDGLVDLPDGCDFDPTVLTCPGGDAPACLTAAQVGAVAQVYAGPRTRRARSSTQVPYPVAKMAVAAGNYGSRVRVRLVCQ